MITYFVTRHPGAVTWAQRQGITVDVQVEHLDLSAIGADDTVIGVLPVHLAAQVCKRGARFFSLAMDLPPNARGHELQADDMERYHARLEPFLVTALPQPSHPTASGDSPCPKHRQRS